LGYIEYFMSRKLPSFLNTILAYWQNLKIKLIQSGNIISLSDFQGFYKFSIFCASKFTLGDEVNDRIIKKQCEAARFYGNFLNQ
jgi:hypothetical protein